MGITTFTDRFQLSASQILFAIGALFLVLVSPELLAAVPSKPNVDVSAIVNMDDGADRLFMGIVSFGIQAVAGVMMAAMLVGFFWKSWTLFSEAVDKNDKNMDVPKAIGLIIFGLLIVVFSLAGLYFMWDYGASMSLNID